MAYLGQSIAVVPGNYGASAFGELRVSLPYTLLDWTWKYSIDALEWGTALVGGGTVTHQPNESSATVAVGTANADRARLRSHTHFRYQAGKGQRVLQSIINSNAGNADQTRRWGQYDDSDGLFWELAGTTFGIVVRTSTSGGAVDTKVNQSAWNFDKLDGTGRSGVTLDLTKGSIFEIDYQWLGVGVVRWFVNGLLVHETINPNTLTVPYMKTAVLPIQYEVVNTAGSTAGGFDAVCVAVRSESGEAPPEYSFGAFNSADISVTTTERPLLSIRPAATFNSLTNRMLLLPILMSVSTEGARAGYRLVFGGTLTGASWSAADAASGAERDSSATAITGGTTLFRSFLADLTAANVDIRAMFQTLARKLRLDAFGTVPDTLTVMGVNEAAGTTNMRASLTWGEVR